MCIRALFSHKPNLIVIRVNGFKKNGSGPIKKWSGPIFFQLFTRITIRLGLWLKRALMHTVYTADFRCPDQIFIWAFGIFPYRSVVNTQKGARRKETWLPLWLPLFYHFLFGGEWLPFQGKTPQKHWTVLEENGEVVNSFNGHHNELMHYRENHIAAS